jgi:hypothetical protein
MAAHSIGTKKVQLLKHERRPFYQPVNLALDCVKERLTAVKPPRHHHGQIVTLFINRYTAMKNQVPFTNQMHAPARCHPTHMIRQLLAGQRGSAQPLQTYRFVVRV